MILENLAEQAASGDQVATANLIARLLPGLSLICKRLSSSAASAQDLRQQALLVFLQQLRSGAIKGSHAAYLRGIAINLARRERAQQALAHREYEAIIEHTIQVQPLCALVHLEQAELKALVAQCVAQLPQARDREILTLSYLKEKDKGSICQRLNIDAQTFDRVISRAKQRLKLALSAWVS